ncbi:AbgT family transporter [Saccharopolyspora sp. ASAGF58]|uniref:AbgT family transporter n=1 Tax=Saccharopolyspora sp. ASAGF58 TaxID=2719023 RepID=UPI00144031E8|nr:AbgT family transporter [Saccharopolyspora sp. ASAGF58]QIZ37371.1 AbgT family transporter [Saccharopolyspora sp. ASAGF58]
MKKLQRRSAVVKTRMNFLFRVISAIERVGNKLPNPFWLFWIMAGILGVVSFVLALLGVSVTLPNSGKIVEVKNLLSIEGIGFAAESALDNFAEFPPVPLVVAMILGVSVAEASGLMTALLRVTVIRLPGRWVTFAIAFASMISHVMGDSAYMVMIPLGALAFRAVGRSPVLGVLVAFVSVSAAFNASPLVTPSAAIRASLTTAAAQTVDPSVVVTPVATYFYAAVASLFLSIVITLVVELVLAKRPEFGQWPSTDEAVATAGNGSATGTVARVETKDELTQSDVRLTTLERRGLGWAGAASLIYVAVVLTLLLIPGSSLLGKGGSIVQSVVVVNIAVFIGLLFAVVGFVYGRATGSISSLGALPKIMADGIIPIAPVLVLFFAASQFLAYFDWTGIGSVVTVEGADLLKKLNAPHLVVLVVIIFAIAVLNMVISSGTAMWAILAPILVPMMMYIDLRPEATLAAFMIGDSATGPVTPMNAYFVLALGYVQRYKKDAGIGTVMSFAIPLSFAILLCWGALFVIWYLTGVPLGPGGYLY